MSHRKALHVVKKEKKRKARGRVKGRLIYFLQVNKDDNIQKKHRLFNLDTVLDVRGINMSK